MKNPAPMGLPDAFAEIVAIQFTLIALINSHADKATLLAQFDGVTAEAQLHMASIGGPRTPSAMMDALMRFRAQLIREPGTNQSTASE